MLPRQFQLVAQFCFFVFLVSTTDSQRLQQVSFTLPETIVIFYLQFFIYMVMFHLLLTTNLLFIILTGNYASYA